MTEDRGGFTGVMYVGWAYHNIVSECYPSWCVTCTSSLTSQLEERERKGLLCTKFGATLYEFQGHFVRSSAPHCTKFGAMSYEVRSVAETSTAMPNLSYYRRVNLKNFIHGGATYRRITFGKSNKGKFCMFTQQATLRHALVYWEEEAWLQLWRLPRL